MNWFKKLFRKDAYLEEVGTNASQYQRLFEKLLEVADDKIWGLPVLRPERSESQVNKWVEMMEKEEKKTVKIFEEATRAGLNQVFLLVIYLQYATADLYDREKNKKHWVLTVLNRKPIDSFPDHRRVMYELKDPRPF